MTLTPIFRLLQILLAAALLQPTIVISAPAPLQFDSFDTNRNGTIERDEASDKRIFDRLDENEDGLVSRAEFDSMNNLLPAPAPTPMTTNLDVAYLEPAAGGNELNRLDIYQPRTGDNYPVLVYVHGGGWSRGDKRAVGFKADHFVAQGYVLVSVNYRLRPDVPITTLQEDLASAVAWVNRNIARYGGDPRNLFLMGHSAGAHLVTMVGTRRDLLAQHRLGLDSIRGVIELDTAALDVPFLMTYSKFHRPIFGSDEQVLRAISPTHHVTPGQHTPPFLLVVAANNRQKLVQSQRFADVLRKAGIGVTTIEAPERTHTTLNRNIGSPKDRYTNRIMGFLEENRMQGSNPGETPGSWSVPVLMRNDITQAERVFTARDHRLAGGTRRHHQLRAGDQSSPVGPGRAVSARLHSSA